MYVCVGGGSIDREEEEERMTERHTEEQTQYKDRKKNGGKDRGRFGWEEMGVHVYIHNKTYIHLNHLKNLMLMKYLLLV